MYIYIYICIYGYIRICNPLSRAAVKLWRTHKTTTTRLSSYDHYASYSHHITPHHSYILFLSGPSSAADILFHTKRLPTEPLTVLYVSTLSCFYLRYNNTLLILTLIIILIIFLCSSFHISVFEVASSFDHRQCRRSYPSFTFIHFAMFPYIFILRNYIFISFLMMSQGGEGFLSLFIFFLFWPSSSLPQSFVVID